MRSLVEQHALSIVIALPALTTLTLVCVEAVLRTFVRTARLPDGVWRSCGLAGALLTLSCAILLVLAGFDPERLGYQLVERAEWIPAVGAHYFVGVDGLNLFFVLLTTLIVPVVLLATWTQQVTSLPRLVGGLLVLESALLGLVLSLNLIQFYAFWESSTLILFFVIGVSGGDVVRSAALRLVAHASLGSALMLTAIVVLAGLSAEQGGVPDLDLVRAAGRDSIGLLETRIPIAVEGTAAWRSQSWMFAGFAIALATRVPLLPLHSWLTQAMRATPTAVSVFLTVAFAVTGVLGFLRFALPLFPDAATLLSPYVLGVAAVAVSYGGLLALVQRNAKQLVANIALAQLGLATVGVFSLNVHGLVGAVVQLLGLGLSLALILILIGALEERRGTLELSDYGGLAKPMPVLSSMLGVAILSSAGFPALAGFVGEWLVLLGAFELHPAVVTGACVGALIVAIALMRLLAHIALGPVENPENRGLIDLDWRERAACLCLIAPLLWIGVQPNPILRRVEPGVLELLGQMDARRTRVKPPSETPAPAPGERDDREAI